MQQNAPDIVRQLREEEQLGRLAADDGILTHLSPLHKESSQDEPQTTTMAIPNITESDLKELYEALVENSLEGTLILDFLGNILYANKALFTMFGYDPEKETLEKSVLQFIDPDYHNKVIKDQLKVKLGKGGYLSTYKAIKKDGSNFWIEGIGTKITYNHKNANVVYIRDITDRITTEDKLATTETLYQDLYETAPIPYQTTTTTGQILNVNNCWLKTFGYKKQDVIGNNVFEFINNDDRERLEKLFNENLKKLKPGEHYTKSYTISLTTKNKTQKTFLINNFLHTGTEEQKPTVHTTLQDISDQKAALAELAKSEERYRILSETLIDGVFTTDTMDRFTYINPSLCEILDEKAKNILGNSLRDYFDSDYIYELQHKLLDVRSDQSTIRNLAVKLKRSDGSLIPVEINMKPLRKNQKFVGIEGTIRDITDRIKIEEELKKSERLRNEFMNIAAHELKSPVTPIKGYLDLIRSDEGANDRIKNWANIALRNSERLLLLVNDILDVSRLETDTMTFNMVRTSTDEMLKNTIEDWTPAIREKGLEFQVNIPLHLQDILADKHRLSQVLKNLFNNAIKFTDQGHIAITACQHDDHLQISIEDTGIGIPKNEAKKIFEKFHQADTADNRQYEGTGLGLFISKEILRKHRGNITVESKTGKGSTFTITLPTLKDDEEADETKLKDYSTPTTDTNTHPNDYLPPLPEKPLTAPTKTCHQEQVSKTDEDLQQPDPSLNTPSSSP